MDICRPLYTHAPLATTQRSCAEARSYVYECAIINHLAAPAALPADTLPPPPSPSSSASLPQCVHNNFKMASIATTPPFYVTD